MDRASNTKERTKVGIINCLCASLLPFGFGRQIEDGYLASAKKVTAYVVKMH